MLVSERVNEREREECVFANFLSHRMIKNDLSVSNVHCFENALADLYPDLLQFLRLKETGPDCTVPVIFAGLS